MRPHWAEEGNMDGQEQTEHEQEQTKQGQSHFSTHQINRTKVNRVIQKMRGVGWAQYGRGYTHWSLYWGGRESFSLERDLVGTAPPLLSAVTPGNTQHKNYIMSKTNRCVCVWTVKASHKWWQSKYWWNKCSNFHLCDCIVILKYHKNTFSISHISDKKSQHGGNTFGHQGLWVQAKNHPHDLIRHLVWEAWWRSVYTGNTW